MNPVYPYYFADPFVFEDQGSYYAYGTGRRKIFEEAREHLVCERRCKGGSLGNGYSTTTIFASQSKMSPTPTLRSNFVQRESMLMVLTANEFLCLEKNLATNFWDKATFFGAFEKLEHRSFSCFTNIQ
jgi:hypothetical protein